MKKENDLNEAYEVELEVEAYSPHELKSKKRKIVARIAIAGVVVVAVIGVAGLIINFVYSGDLQNVIDTIRNATDSNYNVMGGSGSWFLSRMERFDG